jgi:hypothetical protein
VSALLTPLDDVALEALIAREPSNIVALAEQGDRKARNGDQRAAVAFFKAALAAASSLARTGPLPAALRAPIERAQRGLEEGNAFFQRYLEDRLAAAGFAEGFRPPGFQHSLDLMLGRRQPVGSSIQQPGQYFYPGLPQRRYYDAAEFSWGPLVEAASSSILTELETYLADGGGDFRPYLVSNPERPPSNFHGLRDNPAWSTLYLWENGRPNEALIERFPATMAAMKEVDLARISIRAPSILFSRLGPGATIPPHHGAMNARLICHLPMIVPPRCGFRVAGETREWHPGKLLIFDDSVLHEAWNNSEEDRIILIFDCWRPEVPSEDRRAIAAMFEAIDRY